MAKILLIINDIILIILAVVCWFFDDPILEIIVVIATIICVIDLIIKLHKLHYAILPFIKSYWLDIVYLLPICRMFRAMRIIKAGKILKILNISLDVSEIITTIYSVVKRKK